MACSVFKCCNTRDNTKNIRFHLYPNEDTPAFEKWLEAIGITYHKYKSLPLYRKHVCSKHFDVTAYKEPLSRNGRYYLLKKDGMPTLHLYKPDICKSIQTQTGTNPDQESYWLKCIDVATQTAIICFTTHEFRYIDNSLARFQVYTRAGIDGNTARFCYELVHRSLRMDHTYSTMFQSKCESTPLQTPQRLHPLQALAVTYSSSDSSTETEDVGGREADTSDDDFEQRAHTSQDPNSSTSMESTKTTNPVGDTKCTVFESCLKRLLTRCMECGQPISDQQLLYDASKVTVQMMCINSHATRWDSQPQISRYHHTGNNLLSCSLFI